MKTLLGHLHAGQTSVSPAACCMTARRTSRSRVCLVDSCLGTKLQQSNHYCSEQAHCEAAQPPASRVLIGKPRTQCMLSNRRGRALAYNTHYSARPACIASRCLVIVCDGACKAEDGTCCLTSRAPCLLPTFVCRSSKLPCSCCTAACRPSSSLEEPLHRHLAVSCLQHLPTMCLQHWPFALNGWHCSLRAKQRP